MIAFLTSRLCLGRQRKCRLMEVNGFVRRLKERWTDGARVLVVASDPEARERNDSIVEDLKGAFAASGLGVSSFELCDGRDEGCARRLGAFEAVVLAGGHVPTQNAFLERLGLRESLRSFDGILLAWSAGSMNCAETVYALPERAGEGIDPNYRRFLTGLGLTRHTILPHFSDLHDEVVDGMKTIRQMAYPDSVGREFICINDGSYILLEGGGATLYGEGFRLKDGELLRICGPDGSLPLNG